MYLITYLQTLFNDMLYNIIFDKNYIISNKFNQLAALCNCNHSMIIDIFTQIAGYWRVE